MCLPWVLFRPLADKKKLVVSLQLDEDCTVQTSPSYLSSLCRNLLENATKYATPGGRLEIRASQNQLRVYNDCEPLKKEDFDRLTEPFFRPDTSRTSATGGNGLGLSLVSAIANHEGWDLQLEQTGEGFEAVIRMGLES